MKRKLIYSLDEMHEERRRLQWYEGIYRRPAWWAGYLVGAGDLVEAARAANNLACNLLKPLLLAPTYSCAALNAACGQGFADSPDDLLPCWK